LRKRREDEKRMNAGQSRGSGISRRTLLKIGALGTGIAALPSLEAGASKGVPADQSGQIDREVRSACEFCQVRCTTLVQVRNDRVVNVYGNPDNFWTEGGMCPKGQSMVELTYSPHRLLYPLKRDGAGWKRISYEEALGLTAEKILKVKTDFPEDFHHRVVLFSSLWNSRESEVAAESALRMAGFPDICGTGETCIGSSSTALRLCLGSPNSTTTVDEVLNAKLVILLGANIAETYPLYVRWIDKAREKGTKVLYFDPRRTPTSGHCDEQIMSRPGTDGALALGMIRLLARRNLYNKAFVKGHVNGMDEVIKAAEPYTPEQVSKITWIPPAKLEELARRLAESDRTIVYLGGSVSRYANSIQTVRAVVALQAMTGNLGGPGRGIINAQGGGKAGGSESFPNTKEPPDMPPSFNFRKVITAMNRKQVKVLLLSSSYRRYPDLQRVRKAVANVDFVVYRGFFMDEEASLSHLIIPPTTTFESSGSQWGAQRQITWRDRAVSPQGETVEDWRFYSDLGKKINGDPYPSAKTAEEIYNLVRHGSEDWNGMSIERLRKDPTGIGWPCPSEEHPGTKGSMYPDNRFLTPDKKVELRTPALDPIDWTEPEGSPYGEWEGKSKFPLVLIQGKVVHHWQQTFTAWSAYMAQFSEGNAVQVHRNTAKGIGLTEGDSAYLETELGRIRVTVHVTELILPGVVWTSGYPTKESPYGGNKGEPINLIIPFYWDKVTAQFNGCGCRLTKA
jgi:formate dehydrogenase (coenzyme F420) alpha subunit